MSDPGRTEHNGSGGYSAMLVASLAAVGVCFAALLAFVSAQEALGAAMLGRWQAVSHGALLCALLLGLLRLSGLRPAPSFFLGVPIAVATLLGATLFEVVALDRVVQSLAFMGALAVAGVLIRSPFETIDRGKGLFGAERHRAHESGLDVETSGPLKALHAASIIRDGDIQAHGQAVANLAARLGATLGMTPVEVKALYWAALLHDVGKVGVERSVLRKPGKLTRDEFSRVMHHSSIGADLIRGVGPNPLYRMVAMMVLHHHERWDGRGYPSGRTTTDIPVGSRIIAITDVFEALLSERSYRPAMSQDEAVKVITEGSGTHFDPDIVSVFLRMISEQSRGDLSVGTSVPGSPRRKGELAVDKGEPRGRAQVTLAGHN